MAQSDKVRPKESLELEDIYPPEPEVHLRDYLYVVLKRRWIIISFVVVALAISAVKNLRKTPVYSATATVQISRGKLDPFNGVTTYDSWVDYAEFYPTQENILKSYNLAYRVVENLELWKHPLFGNASDSTDPTPNRLKHLAGVVLSMLNVSQMRDTQLLRVGFTTPDPELSAELANTLVGQYISFNSKAETEVARETVSFLREQIDRLEEEIQAKETLLREYSGRDDVIMIDQKEDIVFDQLKDMNDQVSVVRGELAAAEARHVSLKRADPKTLEEVQKDPKIQNLDRRRAALLEQVEQLSSKFKPDWPELQRTRDALVHVEARLDNEINEVARKVVDSAGVEFQSVLERTRLLEEALEEQKQEAQRINRLTAEYKHIQAEVENKRTVLDQLLRRHSEMGMSAELGEGNLVNVRLVDEALVPEHPSGPAVQRGIAMGGLLGLSLALGLVFFLDYWDTAIYTIEDLRRYVPLPFLGMVPRYGVEPVPVGAGGRKTRVLLKSGSKRGFMRRGSEKNLNITKSALSLSDVDLPGDSLTLEESSEVGERFKFIRGSLLMSSAGRPPKVTLITGPEKNAGKTFVACNLAASLAELDKKVLLIDADLRNPQLHKIFGTNNREGLSSFLTGQGDFDSGCIHASSIRNVYLMTAGRSTPSPSELLSSEQMRDVLAECSQRFDYVVLDSAPLLPVFDSHMLTARCDASVFVVRSGKTNRAAIKTSLELVDRVGGKFSGVILNGVDPEDYARSYQYGYRGYGYGYGARDKRSSDSKQLPA